MNCPKCHAENPDGAKFCATCGAPMVEVKAPPPPSDDDFELQPEAPKSSTDYVPPGLAPRIDLDAEESESAAPQPTMGRGKKPEKPKPEKPKNYSNEAKIMMGVAGAYL